MVPSTTSILPLAGRIVVMGKQIRGPGLYQEQQSSFHYDSTWLHLLWSFLYTALVAPNILMHLSKTKERSFHHLMKYSNYSMLAPNLTQSHDSFKQEENWDNIWWGPRSRHILALSRRLKQQNLNQDWLRILRRQYEANLYPVESVPFSLW